jgi:hypothetical protein
MPYATVSASLAWILGFTQSVQALERNQCEMATTVEEFWNVRATPLAQQEGEILVCTADTHGKGVPTRGGGKALQGSQAPSTAGMHPGTKKMALLGGTYMVDAFIRTP